MRNILLKKLEIEHNPIDNEAILEKLKSHEKLLKENNNEVILEKLKSHDEKLDKLEELEKLKELEKLLKEICFFFKLNFSPFRTGSGDRIGAAGNDFISTEPITL
ncbi:hypothetical protein RhiirA5_461952 [Rhizophagus irregularis]|uniref:Uncharacterized protein n=1 Tax=Rhizophagus irregularis TaxID=588596 RepID=A0A2N0NXU5_9GLOM|nr:hypothetical protein RhiirA5_461952 [Rhizophagus irregularis]